MTDSFVQMGGKLFHRTTVCGKNHNNNDGHPCVLLALSRANVLVFLRDLDRFRGSYSGWNREIQLSIDNLIEQAQFQVVSSAGKGAWAGCMTEAKTQIQSSSFCYTPSVQVIHLKMNHAFTQTYQILLQRQCVIHLRMYGQTLMFFSFCNRGLWGTES